MGWFYSFGFSRKELIHELTEPQSNDNGWARRVLRYCVAGNVLWTLNEITAAADGSKTKVIGCDLLQRGPDGWGHKPLDEDSGPCYYTCPLAYLEEAPETNPEWRAKVRAYWNRRREKAARRRAATRGFSDA